MFVGVCVFLCGRVWVRVWMHEGESVCVGECG